MKISTLLTLFPLLMTASVLAGTVLYTDSHHPPSNIDASVWRHASALHESKTRHIPK
ncbi:Uncharacterised protein [Serratia rubidaea]|uniref:Uncharacterized protein n=1 Tax=Serratia rubidaea TaxID=61652 RepID=A0A448SD05_SERRU|nr:hypothetical protein [Serratia rubidaea]VEI65570.1 Uncharacterised protein [Serratia rubidaea]